MNVLSKDFVVEYNESNIRTNIISWYDFKPDETMCLIGNVGSSVEAYLKDKLFVVDTINNKSLEKYDYCFIFDSGMDEFFDPLSDTVLEEVMHCLKTDGKLLAALYNRLGSKYITGGSDDITGQPNTVISGVSDNNYMNNYSKKDALKALHKAGYTNIYEYYPVPDHIFPISVFSQDFLPKEGDIRCESQVYNDCGYASIDEMAFVDKLCKDELYQEFANSFLFVASKCADDKNEEAIVENRIIHAKYNQSRNESFQTKTILKKTKDEAGEEKILTYKQALDNKSESHLVSLVDKYELTKGIYKSIKFEKCDYIENKVYFPYICGHTLDDEIASLVYDKDKLVVKIKELLNEFYSVNEEIYSDFALDTEFEKIFGKVDCAGLKCIKPANLDVIFDNIIINENNEAVGFDYEWTFDITVPENYIVYRILSRIYDKYFDVISSYIDFYDFVECFDITNDEINIFSSMERSFICLVYGDNAYEKFLSRISKKRKSISELSDENNYLVKKCKELEKQNSELQNELNITFSSHSWKATKPLRNATKLAKKCKSEGIGAVLTLVHKRIRKIPFDFGISADRNEIRLAKRYTFKTKAKISIITPLFNTPEGYLKELLESFKAQVYKNIEICLVDFSDKDNKTVEKLVRRYARFDSRIKYRRDYENNGIAKNTNTCIKLATGEYIALLDHDDVLHPLACFYVAKAIDEEGADFIYTDETKFKTNAKNPKAKIIERPYYKPDFSAEELRCHNYICHFNAFKKSLLDEIGGYRSEFDGSQDHDVVLRLTEKAKKIVHIRKVLYYWRVHENSVAISIDAKPYATISGIKAVNEQLQRIGDNVTVRSTYNSIPRYRYNSGLIGEKISLVFWDVKSIKELIRTYEWAVKDINESSQTDETYDFDVAVMGRKGIAADIIAAKELLPFEVRLVSESKDDSNISFDSKIVLNDSSSRINAVSEIDACALESFIKDATTNYTWLIKSGIEPITSSISQELMACVRHEKVACAEAKIIYSDNAVMSGGVICDDNLLPRLQLRCEGKTSEYGGYEDMMLHTRRVSGITGICAIIDNKEYVRLLEAAKATEEGHSDINDMGVNQIVKSSLYSTKMDLECIWTNNAIVRGDLRDYKEKIYSASYNEEDLLKEDPYFNYNIVKYGLE